jgi:hypothetical protein
MAEEVGMTKIRYDHAPGDLVLPNLVSRHGRMRLHTVPGSYAHMDGASVSGDDVMLVLASRVQADGSLWYLLLVRGRVGWLEHGVSVAGKA